MSLQNHTPPSHHIFYGITPVPILPLVLVMRGIAASRYETRDRDYDGGSVDRAPIKFARMTRTLSRDDAN
ncbi:hypothetical protein [Calycomorphotria hydatis]|uniref:Uncharacterized protein n=1 Tax=Calycomorphotria hydatis TaxID=2528027 RepID=A0A517T5N0_9PLAN|nr:hypothetical protein [Calycomorphotria hydatis]QDT63668.1 hypothetical protein V22_08920 [Calycomorphotria hydatis]